MWMGTAHPLHSTMRAVMSVVPRLVLCVVLLTFPPLPSSVAQDADPASAAIQSALQPQFTPPPPGTYALPTIDTVSDHILLDSTGKQVSLFNLTADKIAVFSLMYTG